MKHIRQTAGPIYLSAVALVVFIGGSSRASTLKENWMAVYFQGQKVGHAHMRIQERTADTPTEDEKQEKRYVTTTTQELNIQRGGNDLKFETHEKIVEDSAGRVLSFKRNILQGPLDQRLQGRREGDDFIIVTGEGENEVKQTAEAPDVLGPWAVEMITRRKGYEPGTSYTLPVFTLDAPTRKVTARVHVRGKEDKQIFDATKSLHRVEVELSILPNMETTEWVDSTGTAWLTQTTIGPMELVLRRTPEEAAVKPADGEGITIDMGITPDESIENPRQLQRLVLRISPSEPGSDLPDLPDDSLQTLTRHDDHLIAEIRRASQQEDGYTIPWTGDDFRSYLEETSWLEINHPNIQQMAREAIGDQTDAYRAAQRIESYVAGEIADKNLDLGFATAAETAKERAGDCSEHAVLAAALARAAGIPSRLVAGLAYGGPLPGDKNPRFYFHMWAELYTGEWTPIDPALGSHSATHLAIKRSDLRNPDSLTVLSSAVMGVAGHVDIEVLETQKKGSSAN
ncbi:MAG: transglutaminase-like domain-containing protein [Planctomycetota bacterium]